MKHSRAPGGNSPTFPRKAYHIYLCGRSAIKSVVIVPSTSLQSGLCVRSVAFSIASVPSTSLIDSYLLHSHWSLGKIYSTRLSNARLLHFLGSSPATSESCL